MKTKITTILFVCTLLVGAFSFFSCDSPIALGSKLNMDPPVVTIISPEAMENISGDLVIVGTATDNEEVVQLTVTIEMSASDEGSETWKQEWQNDRGSWSMRQGDGDWTPVSGSAATWNVLGKGQVEWSITTDIPSDLDGEFLITAGAENNVKTRGVKVQLRVIIDTTPPVVSIISPVLEPANNYTAAKALFDTWDLNNPSYLDRLHNQSIELRYDVKDDFSIKTLKFLLLDVNGDICYEQDVPAEELGWSGKVSIKAADIDDSSRLPNKPLYLVLRSIATDDAGNGSDGTSYQNLGWLVWWPEADYPWAVGGGRDASPPPTDADRHIVYPNTDIQVQTFDDDGVQEITYTVYALDGTTWAKTAVTEAITIENEPGENTLSGEPAPRSTFFPWSFKAPAKNGNYVIEIDCVDVNGTHSVPAITSRYFYVQDITPPRVVVTSPPAESVFTVWSQTDGNFTIAGETSSGDTSGPLKLQIAWLNPNGDPQDLVLYRATNYGGWDGSVTDTVNKVWNVTLGAVSYDADYDRYVKTFSHQLNLFSDLGIASGTPLTAQSFVLRVENQAERAMTILHTLRGDIQPPELDIKGIKIDRTTGNIAGYPLVYTIKDKDTLQLNGDDTKTIKTLAEGDVITLSGTWSDNSTNFWVAPHKTSMGNFTVKWNDTNIPAATTTLTETGWTATFTVEGADALSAGGFIIATLYDLGRNAKRTTFQVKVDTNIPVLLSASSEELDGRYKQGDVLDVYLEFNKPVRFWNGTGNTPPPTLDMMIINANNPNTPVQVGTATYAEPTRLQTPAAGSTTGYSDKHRFTYTVTNAATDQTGSRLGISAINANGGAWRANDDHGGATGSAAETIIPTGRNLQQTKQIYIDNQRPAITGIMSLSGSLSPAVNYYKEGVTIYLRVDFNEEITYDAGANGARLTLNATNGSAITVGGTNQNPAAFSTKALLFEYPTADGDNTPAGTPLNVDSFSFNGATIKDAAGNEQTDVSVPANNIVANGKTIYVDTAEPLAPTLTLYSTANSNITGTVPGLTATTSPSGDAFGSQNAVQFEISGTETGATPEYSYRSGTSDGTTITWGAWSTWRTWTATSSPVFESSGYYQIQARQTDLAKNNSPARGSRAIHIDDPVPLLESMGGSSSGTYGGAGATTVNIDLNLRETITMTGTNPVMTLNVANSISGTTTKTTNAVTVVNDTVNGKGILRFTLDIDPGDNVEELHINRITYTGTVLTGTGMSGGINITAEMPRGPKSSNLTPFWEDNQGLETYTKIKIDTSSPAFEKAELTGTTLTLTFSKDILKGGGNIVLTHENAATTYRAPAVLTKAQYTRWGGASVLGTYYTVGTNGLNADGTADTSEKYILNYNIDPAGASGAAVRTALTGQNAHQVSISVLSGAVKRSGKTLTVDLGSTYGFELPVKGVNYIVTFPAANLVQDSQGNGLAMLTGATTANTVLNPGVNAPFIRIQREKATATMGKIGEQIIRSGTTVWVRNAELRSNATGTLASPGAGWVQAEDFSLRLANQAQQPITPADGISTTQTTSPFIPGPTNPAPKPPNREQTMRLNNGNYEWGWGGGTTVNNYYVNPYVFPYLDGHGPLDGAGSINGVAYADNEINGMLRMSGVWVNMNTVGIEIRTQENHPNGQTKGSEGTGWIKVIENPTITVVDIMAPLATQPAEASVKIDSQTPGATIRYAYRMETTAPFTGKYRQKKNTQMAGNDNQTFAYNPATSTNTFTGANPGGPTQNTDYYPMPTAVMPTDAQVSNTTGTTGGITSDSQNPFPIGTGDRNGNYFAIKARAQATNGGQTHSAYAGDTAARSVIVFGPVGNGGTGPASLTDNDANVWNPLNALATAEGKQLQLWIRGGDALSGANSTPGFPLAWDLNDHLTATTDNPSGARLFTQLNTTNGGTWYWMSWEVTVPAYFHFMAGTTVDAAGVVKGPVDWSWAKNAWAHQQKEYPLFPGASLHFDSNSTVSDPATMSIAFFTEWSGSRP